MLFSRFSKIQEFSSYIICYILILVTSNSINNSKIYNKIVRDGGEFENFKQQ